MARDSSLELALGSVKACEQAMKQHVLHISKEDRQLFLCSGSSSMHSTAKNANAQHGT